MDPHLLWKQPRPPLIIWAHRRPEKVHAQNYCVPSNGLISSPFLGKTFFLSKNHEGDTLNFLNKKVSKIGA